MITLFRAEARHHVQQRERESWQTLHALDRNDALTSEYGALESLTEERLAPGGRLPLHADHDVEIVTYVRQGALAHEDSTGRSGVIQAGEFQCVSANRRVRHGQTNASRTDSAHVFHFWLRSAQSDFEPKQQQQRFSAAQRRGLLCVVAAQDARKGALRIRPDALIHSALLEPGQHLVHELAPGRAGWVHLVCGETQLRDAVMTTGDSAGLTNERAISLTARNRTELLLFDLHSTVVLAANSAPV